MTGLSLFGSLGVSTHSDRLVRLWDARSGRRIAADRHRDALTACVGRPGLVAVGNASGGLYLYGTESAFHPCASR